MTENKNNTNKVHLGIPEFLMLTFFAIIYVIVLIYAYGYGEEDNKLQFLFFPKVKVLSELFSCWLYIATLVYIYNDADIEGKIVSITSIIIEFLIGAILFFAFFFVIAFMLNGILAVLILPFIGF
jgi:hypothetical protein